MWWGMKNSARRSSLKLCPILLEVLYTFGKRLWTILKEWFISNPDFAKPLTFFLKMTMTYGRVFVACSMPFFWTLNDLWFSLLTYYSFLYKIKTPSHLSMEKMIWSFVFTLLIITSVSFKKLLIPCFHKWKNLKRSKIDF